MRVLAASAVVFALLAVAALLVRVANSVRGTPVEVVLGGAEPLGTSSPDFAYRASFLSETALLPGNRVEILEDAHVFERMIPDLAAARSSVTFLGYYCGVGALAERIVEVLEERARAGVKVLFLGDGFGCRHLLDEVRAPLIAAGAQVASFRPLRWYWFDRAQHRMHARSVVIDGRVGYTGGFGIDDKWTEATPDEPMWRDVGVRFAGPAVLQMQATFLAAWAEATGSLVSDETFLPGPPEAPEGEVQAGLLYSSPGIGPTTAERHLAVTISAAERTLYIANSYFIPTGPVRRLLTDAARRGVDVRVLVPNRRTDIPIARFAGRGFYEELLESGVKVYEYQPAMMHAKTIVADGVWSAIGSVNMDNRSIRLNDESALLVFDRGVGARMDSLFLADLRSAHEITLESHRRRPIPERIFEVLTRLVAPLL